MAINTNITLQGGIIVICAYCRIERGNFDKDAIVYYVAHYKDQESAQDRQNKICGDKEFNLTFTEDAMSLPELYANLSQQDVYKDGVMA